MNHRVYIELLLNIIYWVILNIYLYIEFIFELYSNNLNNIHIHIELYSIQFHRIIVCSLYLFKSFNSYLFLLLFIVVRKHTLKCLVFWNLWMLTLYSTIWSISIFISYLLNLSAIENCVLKTTIIEDLPVSFSSIDFA